MKLTAENYYSLEANRHYMSVSQYKDFLSCEAQAMARLNGWKEPQQDCFLLGSYVHAAFDGTLEQFKSEHPEIISSKGATKGELKAEYRNADVMIAAVRNDELCASMTEGQHEVIVTAELFGVLWKARIDVLNEEQGRIVDLKTIKSLRERFYNAAEARYETFIEHYGYHLQMAVYSELERLYSRRFERLEPFIVAVSKEDVPDKAVICFDDETLGAELGKLADRLPRVIEVKSGKKAPKRCGKCRYCRETKKSEIIHFLNLLEA